MNPLIRGTLACLVVVSFIPGIQAAEPEDSSLAQQVQAILKADCHRCHGHDGANEGGFNFVLDRQRLVNRKKIVPGDAAKSKLFRRLVSSDDPIPPPDEKPRPTTDEIALIKKWIDAGAPEVAAAAAARRFLAPADVVAAIE